MGWRHNNTNWWQRHMYANNVPKAAPESATYWAQLQRHRAIPLTPRKYRLDHRQEKERLTDRLLRTGIDGKRESHQNGSTCLLRWPSVLCLPGQSLISATCPGFNCVLELIFSDVSLKIKYVWSIRNRNGASEVKLQISTVYITTFKVRWNVLDIFRIYGGHKIKFAKIIAGCEWTVTVIGLKLYARTSLPASWIHSPVKFLVTLVSACIGARVAVWPTCGRSTCWSRETTGSGWRRSPVVTDQTASLMLLLLWMIMSLSRCLNVPGWTSYCSWSRSAFLSVLTVPFSHHLRNPQLQ